ncbi:MAG: TIGR03560 family F420-dependent LLM class oxidoreductase [Candidatus Binatia bacterium]
MSEERDTNLSRRGFIKTAGAAGIAVTLTGCASAVRAKEAAPPKRGGVRFGIQTPPQQVTYQEIADVWKEADDLGFDSLFAFDHFMPIYSDITGPCLEGWTLLAALAAQTRQAHVGLLVTGNTYRYPAVLAKMAATVDQISNGRLIVGIGAGWFETEHIAYGIPFYTPGGRARRLGESVQVLKLLLTEPRSNFNGKYYRLKDALCEPKPIQKPHLPILVGGVGPKLLQPIAARYADIWHFFARSGEPREARTLCASFDAACRRVGRDPATVEKATSLRADQFKGSLDDVRPHVQQLRDVGVRHFILQLSAPYDREAMRRFARQVMPALREA